jgi:hypothetical protein
MMFYNPLNDMVLLMPVKKAATLAACLWLGRLWYEIVVVSERLCFLSLNLELRTCAGQDICQGWCALVKCSGC